MSKLKTWQEQLQEMVDKGIDAAEQKQKKLASKPFDMAEKLETEVRQYRVKNLRKRYNGASGAMFEQLRGLNNRVGGFAAEMVARLEKESAETTKAVEGMADSVTEAVSGEAKPTKAPAKPRKTASARSASKPAGRTASRSSTAGARSTAKTSSAAKADTTSTTSV